MEEKEKRYCILEHGKETGPFTAAQLRERYANGEIDGDTICIPKFGLFKGWKPLKDFFPDLQMGTKVTEDYTEEDIGRSPETMLKQVLSMQKEQQKVLGDIQWKVGCLFIYVLMSIALAILGFTLSLLSVP